MWLRTKWFGHVGKNVMSADTESEIAHEGNRAARRVGSEFDKVGDCLDYLQREHDNEDALEAFRKVEDLVMDLDDAMYEAQQVFEDAR
jgi:hypothetical protein